MPLGSSEGESLALHAAHVLCPVAVLGGGDNRVPPSEVREPLVHHRGHAVHVILKGQVVGAVGDLLKDVGGDSAKESALFSPRGPVEGGRMGDRVGVDQKDVPAHV